MPDEENSPNTRSSYLLDGRRVTVSDLLNADLIKPGEALKFTRPRIGKTHDAKVTAAGGVEYDSHEFKSPSSAAAAAAEIRACDGWHAWTVVSTGVTLDGLRQNLLDQVAASPLEESNNSVTDLIAPRVKRHEFLKNARRMADEGNPVAISVRNLLDWWGAKSRGYVISQQIEADLANHDLITAPSFRKVSFGSTVQLVGASHEVEDAEVEEPTESASVTVITTKIPLEVVEDELEVGLTVGNVDAALTGVTFVSPNSNFDEAITQMVINDFSQVAVLSGKHNLRGAVTWQSITRARHANPSATFADAIISAQSVSYDHELIDILPVLTDRDFVFVLNDKKEVAGIVTTADVVNAYGELAIPFFLIGELDQRLRQVISRNFDLEDVKDQCNSDGRKPITTFDDLAFGDYQWVLQNPKSWTTLGWPLDGAVFSSRLEEIRIIRNDVMHFNPDPPGPDAVQKIRNMIKLIRDYGDVNDAGH
ncbi:hypothetical protein OG548_33640 [Streptomyces sp. NBC_01356]|uniref:restriction system modified-DNA reader domain-containing protein n=1 Tax=Streptomyces sp. NBC_01356 TaxID=2903836 RepID=UPI002E35D6CB|nr:hypothetical protein [Streptomyces sp. NBC_01356]